jgi:hypothetical protein
MLFDEVLPALQAEMVRLEESPAPLLAALQPRPDGRPSNTFDFSGVLARDTRTLLDAAHFPYASGKENKQNKQSMAPLQPLAASSTLQKTSMAQQLAPRRPTQLKSRYIFATPSHGMI